jgi:hypothetical protein
VCPTAPPVARGACTEAVAPVPGPAAPACRGRTPALVPSQAPLPAELSRRALAWADRAALGCPRAGTPVPAPGSSGRVSTRHESYAPRRCVLGACARTEGPTPGPVCAGAEHAAHTGGMPASCQWLTRHAGSPKGLKQGWQRGIPRRGIAPHPRPRDEKTFPRGSPRTLAGSISFPSPFPAGINP